MALQQEQRPSALTTKPEKKSYASIVKWILAILVIAGIAWIVVTHRQASDQNKARAKSDLASRPMPVLVAKAEQRDVNVYLDALGTVTPRNTITVRARVDGQLLNVYFREGQLVKSGELLAQIDPRPFEVQLGQAEGQLTKDKALLDNALIDADRYKTLLAQDSISKQQADTQQSLVNQYRGAIAVDQATVDSAKLQLSYCRITAPISGRVGLRQVDPGNLIHSADTTGIVTITQLQPITVLFNIPEDDLPAVVQRAKAVDTVAVDAYDRAQKIKLASGSLLTTDNQIDTTTGSIKLRAVFKNENETLFPNQFVNIKLLVDIDKDATVIPQSALQRGKNGDYVYTVNPDQSVTLKQVIAGDVEGESVSIKKGLNPGETLVIDGADKLRDGAKVKVTTPDAAQKDTPDNAKKRGHSKEGWQHKQSAE
ncbi:MAG TPA: MdtA/MuxA family multidrug efflux RND transporter periplasmic adaptor subunit [Methylophilaceae bacterium]|jgi:multidrug efflux system membrane fusion protein